MSSQAKTGTAATTTMTPEHAERLRALGRAVINVETQALADLESRVDDNFVRACVAMLGCEGRIVVIGMGKSGHVGSKVAATLASTGTPAFFVHPGEASHGDLGMITPKDVVLALSNSGETEEILVILPIIKRLAVPLIALTGNPKSTLGRNATVHIDVHVDKEACPLGLAPTASTTAALAMGDALAIAMLEFRGFTEADFARSHPGGRLGRRLLLHVSDIMRTGDEIPVVRENAPLTDGLLEMSKKGMGMTAVVDAQRHVVGVFTDGDLRRGLDRGLDVRKVTMRDAMTPNCVTIRETPLAAEGVQVMQARKVYALLVTDESGALIGAINMHDMLRAGVV